MALQPNYSLMERAGYEAEYADLVAREGLGVLPYWSLARGFLTGKYRDGAVPGDSPRAASASAYLDDRGRAVLAAMDEIAAARSTAVAAVALAWLRTRPNVVSPIASARAPEQLAELLPVADLVLDETEVARLDEVSAPGRLPES